MPASPPAGLVRDWLGGWAASRDLPPAEPVDGAWRTRVGTPGREVEYVVLDADRDPRRIDRVARASLDDRDPWVTVPTADPGRVADRLAEHGLTPGAVPEWLMTGRLDAQPPAAPARGYAVATTRPTAVRIEVAVTGEDGTTAASGRLGLAGEVGVPDMITTAGAHRRRGLGSVVMARLGAEATALGVVRGVLLASDQGRRLYLSLGWELVGAVVVARRR